MTKLKTVKLELEVSEDLAAYAREVLAECVPTSTYPIPGDRAISMIRYGLDHIYRQRRFRDRVAGRTT